ncbi:MULTISPECIES: adenine deaminase [Roseobacteraceae]|uniref:Adenine deaminase n=1 Tax=Celeribacter baekdonensis B30 TaxID=1208323 RepID=K2JAL8_9RHOB|nr:MULTISPECIES: adenine deaminase [Roseobacteraceae]EKE71892.1 adenine deaminase [Celeribacter baekdonensis B30]KAB6715268.1 adenine deaminase [Roseobacter sp. TSBP12]|tara:strand:- start:6391 stop:8085 length:1695 start_codon:yes stop_codon:yes gene_type:complete
MSDLEHRIAVARGEVPADIVLKGGMIFDLMTGALITGDVAIVGDRIAGVYESYEGAREIDVSGQIIVPGFIDTHLHIESSLVTPFEFDRCVAPRGVTTAICDPHEIANVIGLDGIRYFQAASEHTVMDIRVQLSSCVPSTHMETAGAELLAEDLAKVMGHRSAIGLAEFMNYPGVIYRDPEAMKKLYLFEDAHIDGHCPQLSGRDLNAYIAAGIRTEHEATTADEAREKLRKGMRVLIREGSVSKDLHALQPLLSDLTAPYMCLCTDDRNPLDIGEHGHLDYMIRTLIALGCSPLAVYRAASLSAAEAFGFKDRGMIAPGKRADLVVIDSLEGCHASRVFAGGVEVTEAAFAARGSVDPIGRHSVKARKVTAEDFRTTGNREQTDVIGILEGKIITEHLHETIPIIDGDKRPDPTRDLTRITVIERHGKNGNIASGFVKGFGVKAGAIASTVCHDHHNIVAVGVDYDDMALAANRLSEIEGGFVVVRDGVILAELALPVAGLMSLLSFEEVRDHLVDLRAAAASLGVTLEEPFLQLAFLALPVIPALKITDRGMVDVIKFEIIV